MSVRIEEDLCIGCGVCVSTCPDVFELNDEGKAIVISEDYSACDVEDVAESCPVDAIIVEE